MKDKFSENIIIFSCIIFLFLCLGLLSLTTHAATPGNLPVFVDNDSFPISTFSDYLRQNYNFTVTSNPGAFCYKYSENDYYDIYMFYTPYNNATYTTNITLLNYPNFNTNTDTLNMNLNVYPYADTNDPVYFVFIVRCNKNTYQIVNSSAQNSSASITIPFFYGSNNTMVWVGSEMYAINSTNQYGLIFTPNVIPIDIGTAILPTGLFTPDLSDIVPPTKVPPTYTPSDYTWTQKPTIDTSSTDNLLKSIFGVIEWGMQNLDGEFNTLKTNLNGWFKYFGDLLTYYLNGIVESINSGIQNFYENMANLVQPIFDKIDYLTQPIDGTVIYDNISTTSLVSNISTINSCLSSFQTSFNNVSEPSSFTIPIHLELLPSTYFGTQTTQYIDLGILGSTEKGIIRTFMWALITYSLFITIVDSISNYINGGGDES